MDYSIGETLKKCRIDAGKSVKEISDLLISKGFKASEKTIYSWEKNNSQPTPGALLIMCKAYGINDVLETFGYGHKKNVDSEIHRTDFLVSLDEKEHIEKYRKLDNDGRKLVDTVTLLEVKRTNELQDVYKRYMAYAEILNKKIKENSSVYKEDELLAAHERTDIEVTPEGVQNDLDIMNDEDLWK